MGTMTEVGDEMAHGGSGGHEEKIFVSVRLRPLNEREAARNDVSDWECINDNTIIYKNANLSVSERSMYPSAYTFDRVFSWDHSTRQVYEQGAKEVALSVVSGINSTVFAYGQTSSGKTYTMTGITEYTIADIYDYIQKHKDREFLLKFSAIEIYNESVRDLLSADNTPLRLLDDPEKGTVVEKLTEETLRDWNHVRDLLSICEAQRQIGETSLNETSSRSHQIIRLTIESSARELLGRDNLSTLVASVNFVDLAGSERASQTLSAGTRLKEGCHINRSLLTLGTVIRKLSKGRNGHIPFRDSKLTRILQSSLGGNGRTAIICTLSPARSHAEQSRNTLLFASCAKEVITNAQVNVVMSDKALVKHLQRELTRLENELRSPGSTCVTPNCAALLQEKDLQIVQLEKEIKDLTLQLEMSQSLAQKFLQMVGDDEISLIRVGLGHYPNMRVRRSPESDNLIPETAILTDTHTVGIDVRSFGTSRSSDAQSSSNSDDHCIQLHDFEENFLHSNTSARPLVKISLFSESDSYRGWEEFEEQSTGTSEELCREVQCTKAEGLTTKRHVESRCSSPEETTGISALIVVANRDIVDQESISPPFEEDAGVVSPVLNKDKGLESQRMEEDREMMSLVMEDRQVESPLLKEVKDLSFTQSFAVPSPEKPSPRHDLTNNLPSARSLKLTKSRSCKASIMTSPCSPWFDKLENNESTPPHGIEKDLAGRPKVFRMKLSALNYEVNDKRLLLEGSPPSIEGAVDTEVEAQIAKASIDEKVTIVETCSTGTKETVELQHDSHVTDNSVEEIEEKGIEPAKNVKDIGLDPIEDGSKSHANWPSEFKRLQREIIELWHACNMSLVHRTYFFLLFKGDPTDSIYMEVELRRLSFLKDTFSRGSYTLEDGQALTASSSLKALQRERHMLSKQMAKRLSEQDRENLYIKWGIKLNSKNRRLQLAYSLWTKTEDMGHIAQSAILVAKLVGFIEPGQAPKEMFGLNFAPRRSTRTYSLKRSFKSLL